MRSLIVWTAIVRRMSQIARNSLDQDDPNDAEGISWEPKHVKRQELHPRRYVRVEKLIEEKIKRKGYTTPQSNQVSFRLNETANTGTLRPYSQSKGSGNMNEQSTLDSARTAMRTLPNVNESTIDPNVDQVEAKPQSHGLVQIIAQQKELCKSG